MVSWYRRLQGWCDIQVPGRSGDASVDPEPLEEEPPELVSLIAKYFLVVAPGGVNVVGVLG